MSSLYPLKSKVKMSLCLTKHHAMKTIWVWGWHSAPLSLTLAIDGGEW